MKQKTVIGVMGLAVKSDGRFLLTQRHQPDTPAWHNKWNIPGGGVEFGEDPRDALDRELWEELRVKPRLLLPHPFPVNITWLDKDTHHGFDFHLLMLCYLVDIGNQEIDLSGDPEQETAAYQWYSLDELDSVECLPQTPETVRAGLALLKQHATIGK